MATVTQTQYTPEDLLSIDDRPMPELVDGQLEEREMGLKSDAIAAVILYFLAHFVRTNQLGQVNGAQGSYQIFPDDPKKVRIPDVSFTRRERIPAGGLGEGHGHVVPDLIVEVTSPNDSVKKLDRKIKDFLNVGVSLLWIVYTESQTILVLRPDGTTRRLQVGDFLEGEDVLPGFRLQVAALFE
jgi:Uma2 family endonuclease